MSDRLKMIRLGAKGSLAHSISTAPKRTKVSADAMSDPTVFLSLQDTFPPLSSARRKKKMHKTSKVAPAKSTRLIFALKSVLSVEGKWSANETEMKASITAGN